MEEVRKELQKVKEEIIEGEVVWEESCPWERALFGRGEAPPLTSALCFLPAFVQELRKRGSP